MYFIHRAETIYRTSFVFRYFQNTKDISINIISTDERCITIVYGKNVVVIEKHRGICRPDDIWRKALDENLIFCLTMRFKQVQDSMLLIMYVSLCGENYEVVDKTARFYEGLTQLYSTNNFVLRLKLLIKN